jgi:hypothetical protein
MNAKLLKPLTVAAMNGAVILITLPVDAKVEFDPIADDVDLSDDDLFTDVFCDGESYLANSEELLDAIQPVGLVRRP